MRNAPPLCHPRCAFSPARNTSASHLMEQGCHRPMPRCRPQQSCLHLICAKVLSGAAPPVRLGGLHYLQPCSIRLPAKQWVIVLELRRQSSRWTPPPPPPPLLFIVSLCPLHDGVPAISQPCIRLSLQRSLAYHNNDASDIGARRQQVRSSLRPIDTFSAADTIRQIGKRALRELKLCDGSRLVRSPGQGSLGWGALGCWLWMRRSGQRTWSRKDSSPPLPHPPPAALHHGPRGDPPRYQAALETLLLRQGSSPAPARHRGVGGSVMYATMPLAVASLLKTAGREVCRGVG